MKVSSQKKENGDLEITLLFDSHEQHCLNHDLVDIVDWYSSGPAREKIENCKKRMIKEHKDNLLKSPEMQSKTLAEVNAILSDERALCESITKLPNYKNRAMREREAILSGMDSLPSELAPQ
jgi:hypothetical protein